MRIEITVGPYYMDGYPYDDEDFQGAYLRALGQTARASWPGYDISVVWDADHLGDGRAEFLFEEGDDDDDRPDLADLGDWDVMEQAWDIYEGQGEVK